ncbi:MAG TPA: Uma2 family endonuclease [Acidisarcina sp.]
MATATHIPVSEYLQTSYRPDREYIDGDTRERNVGKYEHARIQALLTMWFGRHESFWSAIVVTEQRVRVSPTRIRIPDVALIRPGRHPEVLIQPPLLVVEIMSPDDTYSDTEERAADYLAMGIKTVWIIDPKTRTGRMCIDRSWIASERLEVQGTAIYVELPEIFRYLDDPSGAA